MDTKKSAQRKRATDDAKAQLKQGDKLLVTRCGGGQVMVKFSHWDGQWIVTPTLSDVHALHILKVNGVSRRFGEAP